jgi:hypothetical protein
MASPKTSTGFVSLMDYLGNNAPAVARTADTLADSVSDEGDQAKAGADSVAQRIYTQAHDTPNLDPTSVAGFGGAQKGLANAAQAARNLGGFGGIATELSRVGHTPGGYGGGRALDANLLAGNQQLTGVAAKYGSLDNYLSNKMVSARDQGATAGAHEGAGAPVGRVEPAAPRPPSGPPPMTPGQIAWNEKNGPRNPGRERPLNPYSGGL